MRIPAAVIAFTLLASAASAQTPGLGETRPLPDGDAAKQDPAALERGAVPRAGRSRSDAALVRCEALSGAPREACLREERDAAAGASRRAEPPSAPPPQNPR